MVRHHDAAGVAAAFTSMCLRWGAPDVVCMDNVTEFVNTVVKSLLQLLDVHVRTGAVRHTKLQGSAEQFNRTLFGLNRKKLTDSTDWRADLEVLLFQYRSRPPSITKISPMMAMSGWQPRDCCGQRGGGLQSQPVEYGVVYSCCTCARPH